VTFAPRGEWHGFRGDPGKITRALFTYLGAAALDGAGYELLEEPAPASGAEAT
jgi:hypothetical protein